METDIILSMPNSPYYAGELIRVRGLVQGVGFRPAVWHLAGELHLQGEVLNDAAGVLIKVWGEQVVLKCNLTENLAGFTSLIEQKAQSKLANILA